jgi:glutaredoxin
LEIPVNSVARDSETAKQQQCTVRSLYLSATIGAMGYVVGLVFFAYEANWAALLLWLVFVPCLKWAYVRFFPSTSKWRGYGRVDDTLPASVTKARVGVTYYFLRGCPFCPIVEQRLKTLQKEMDFTLTKIDLTLRPRLSASKGIRSVPVVEAGQDRLIGNATSQQLADLISCAQALVPSPAVSAS